MTEGLFRNETPSELFRDLVESAMANQHLDAREHTSFYLVNLLTACVQQDRLPGRDGDAPLGVRLAEALQTAGLAQRDGLRRVGDQSLFISGFFGDSLNRSLVDVDYYVQLGECAYGCLARREREALGEVFDELAEKFTAFVDVLGEVSERTSLASNRDLMRLYERWLRTGSTRSARLLASKGIVPHPQTSRLVQ
jgi:hypothetical protein